ncbi:hypothetical protein DF052_01610 [Burkholderia glumae]|nr:hypothetical protein DF052_01610 [Burkholderia glumae]
MAGVRDDGLAAGSGHSSRAGAHRFRPVQPMPGTRPGQMRRPSRPWPERAPGPHSHIARPAR